MQRRLAMLCLALVTSLFAGCSGGGTACGEGMQTCDNACIPLGAACTGMGDMGMSTQDDMLVGSDASLASLSVSPGGLNPAFSPTVTTYTVTAPLLSNTLTVTAAAIDAQATIKVNGTVAAGGTAQVTLTPGLTMILVEVTSGTGVKMSYTIAVVPSLYGNLSSAQFAAASRGLITGRCESMVRRESGGAEDGGRWWELSGECRAGYRGGGRTLPCLGLDITEQVRLG